MNNITAVLKDVPNFPLELLKNPEMDAARMALFPNLDYKGLYNALVPLIEVAPLVQNGLEGTYLMIWCDIEINHELFFSFRSGNITVFRMFTTLFGKRFDKSSTVFDCVINCSFT